MMQSALIISLQHSLLAQLSLLYLAVSVTLIALLCWFSYLLFVVSDTELELRFECQNPIALFKNEASLLVRLYFMSLTNKDQENWTEKGELCF
jgi:hypothetical protein